MNTNYRFLRMIAFMPTLIFFPIVLASAADHIVIPISNPLKPVTVNVMLHSGSVSVTGYAGKEVVLEVQSRKQVNQRDRNNVPPAGSANLKRISSPDVGLAIHEENNVVTIGNGTEYWPVEVSLQTPSKVDLVVNTGGNGNIIVNKIEGSVKINNNGVKSGGRKSPRQRVGYPWNIEVHQIKGDVEINNGSGAILMDKISGSAIAYTNNGALRASFISVKKDKPMSFSSMNGTIDVWLPPDIKADVTAQSAGGAVNSDFDIKINSSTVASKGIQYMGRKYSNRGDRIINGKINGGGAEIRFKTYKGNIYFRKFSEASAKPPTKK